MTLKELFKKIDAYNEIAEMMGERKAAIHFTTHDPAYSIPRFGETFKDYDSLRKYARKNYTKDLADLVLKCSEYEFDKDITFEWVDYWGNNAEAACAELVAVW